MCLQVSSSPRLLVPCTSVPGELQQPEQLSAVCTRALNNCNGTRKTALPNCRYVQLTTFSDMQRHIR
jgi:hypothetical protein